MRVLCLHGMGTNAGIFEAQTEIFRSLLPEDLEYDFFDADHEIGAADGVEGIFPGPYTCWYPVPTQTNVKDAHQVVWDLIEEEGPFDIVMGFSQGAALAASVLLHHQIEHPLTSAPFKLAIFICGSLPYCVDSQRGVDVARLFAEPSTTGFGPPRYITYKPSTDDGSSTAHPLYEIPKDVGQGRLRQLERRFNMASIASDEWDQIPVEPGLTPDMSESSSDSDSDAETVSPVFSRTATDSTTPSTANTSGDEGDDFPWKSAKTAAESIDHVIRRYHADVDALKIEIPTAHIYGSKDPYHRQSLELERLCDPRWASSYEHPEGHVVPRRSAINQDIAGTIGKALAAVDICAR